MNRLVGKFVPCVQQLRRFIEQLAHPLRIMFADRSGDRVTLRRSAEHLGVSAGQQFFHLGIAAVLRDLYQIAADAKRLCAVIQQERCNLDLILPHGK